MPQLERVVGPTEDTIQREVWGLLATVLPSSHIGRILIKNTPKSYTPTLIAIVELSSDADVSRAIQKLDGAQLRGAVLAASRYRDGMPSWSFSAKHTDSSHLSAVNSTIARPSPHKTRSP